MPILIWELETIENIIKEPILYWVGFLTNN